MARSITFDDDPRRVTAARKVEKPRPTPQRIGLDYGLVYCRDPELWAAFVQGAAKQGHHVWCLVRTGSSSSNREVAKQLSHICPRYAQLAWLPRRSPGQESCTDREARLFLLRLGIQCDIWIGD